MCTNETVRPVSSRRLRRLISSVLCGLLLILGPSLRAGSLTGWIVSGGPPEFYEIAVDATEKQEGAFSASISCASSSCDGASFGTLLQVIRADEYRGKRLRFSGHVASRDIELWAGLRMRVDGDRLASLAFDNMRDRPVRGTTPWTRDVVVLNVPEDATQILFGILMSGNGQLWADDFRLEAVGKEVPTTGEKPDPQPLGDADKRAADSEQPVNLGLEE